MTSFHAASRSLTHDDDEELFESTVEPVKPIPPRELGDMEAIAAAFEDPYRDPAARPIHRLRRVPQEKTELDLLRELVAMHQHHEHTMQHMIAGLHTRVRRLTTLVIVLAGVAAWASVFHLLR